MADVLQTINTPAYVIDVAALKHNMKIVETIRKRAGVKILLATKAFATTAAFEYMQDSLDGTTSSGLYEAYLGHTHFGKEVHTYSPAYSADELHEVLPYTDHIYFNSISQLQRFAPFCKDKSIGLRLNAQFSQVTNCTLYDPSAPTSRFGVHKHEITDEVLDQIDTIHVHNLCENLATDSVKLIEHISSEFGFALNKVKTLNIGGGHFLTHPDYDINMLISALKAIKAEFDIDVILEPGGAHVYEAGYMVSTVLDVIENRETPLAILDTSASAHMPDILEMPYTPTITNKKGNHTYTLGGKTCMSGDVIGTYSFDKPLEVGSRVIFTDMLQYTMVKNTTFNGLPLPDIGVLHEDGTYELAKAFSYADFEERLSSKTSSPSENTGEYLTEVAE